MTSTPISISKTTRRRTETPAQRLARLTRDYQLAKAEMKEHQQRTLAAIGAALLAEAKATPEATERLRDILSRRITAKAVLMDIEELLNGSR